MSLREPLVLSIQSHMVHGRSGNRSATFPLEVNGIEVDPINTCHYSAHTAYPYLMGTVMDPAEFDTIVDGLRLNQILPKYTHLITGYLADPSIAIRIAELKKELGNSVKYFCDPVLGDVGEFYVSPECLDVIKSRLIPIADTITPNAYEAMWLTGKEMKNPDQLLKVVDQLHNMGPKNVVITSTEWNQRMIFFSMDNGRHQVAIETPSLKPKFEGPGDVFTSLLLANIIKYKDDIKLIAERTVNSVYALLERTANENREELALPMSAKDLIEPKIRFKCISVEEFKSLKVKDQSVPLSSAGSH
ncbi:pyridoxal kinase family protein [Tritrichomonas foetus]|uniref:pyridoxal kinase n=1 Tax=Tritrichomonas foetus TaxID=1144522 RepID=A0A1J4KTB9_9EUKA|nr:pyridoxal kinase family protein [Tritrichomonas foetus]|eukprot:OHT14128.1 pyridoxal kinase family protein [Tritrichomonas foetus]